MVKHVSQASHAFRSKKFILTSLLLMVLVPSIPMSYADRVIDVQTVANVNENLLISAITDLQNYPQIFPDNVKYVKVLDNKTNLVDMNAGLNVMYFDTQAIYQQTPDGRYLVQVVSGDLKGTTMTTELNKTWGFDGKPGMGTKVDISLDLKTSGFLSWMLNFVPDNSLSYALQNGFSQFVNYAQKG
ncbi:MAG: SRPBCC family protein [Thaumarchaeota archaeon]|nr:SRPBCC family protein [Nitrososphaerota archaeon]